MATKSEKILTIAERRGFFYPSAEIYGATAGFWTYGHLGTLLKHKWENLWRDTFLKLNPNYFEIDDCVIMPEKVFESSGHLEHFNDPLTSCKKCNSRFAADKLVSNALGIEADGLSPEALTKLIRENKLICPECQGELSDVKQFNMMFQVKVGALGEITMYLRPESAQSPYLAFKREIEALRRKLPLGLAVIGKAFRNEISPRQGFFRLREFTQAELQIFFDPDKINEADKWKEIEKFKVKLKFADADKEQEVACKELNSKYGLPKFYVFHMASIQKFYLEKLQIPKELFRFRELSEKERAFYNKIHFDIELNLETLGGFKEVAGLHYRGDHDLGGHQKGSGEKLDVVTDTKRVLPHVLELSFGVDRNICALMDIFYKEEKERTLFSFPQCLSPLDVAVYPLVNRDNLPEKAQEIFDEVSKEFRAFYDTSGSIGRRYRRQDEIGTKYGITVDNETLKDGTVTVRERDSMEQIRVSSDEVLSVLKKLFRGEADFKKAGKPLK